MTWAHDDPRWEPHAKADPVLKDMLAGKGPLTRQAWLDWAWGPDV
jgi:hypothetical protein